MHTINGIEESDVCANVDVDDDGGDETNVLSGNADMDSKIITNDAPDHNDSQNNHETSLGENRKETKANDLTSNVTLDNKQTSNSVNPSGSSEFKCKHWHRHLRTPVWARCFVYK